MPELISDEGTLVPKTPKEVFGVANELGVQGRLVNNALHPIGELASLLNLGIRFGDSQYGINSVLVEGDAQKKGETKKEAKRNRGQQQAVAAGDKLVPDVVVADIKIHAIRILGEVKTFWRFEPKKGRTWEEFIADKMGQLTRYMDDSYATYGFFSIYERTWFLKRVGENKFALSPAIDFKAKPSATDVSIRECFFAIALRAADVAESRYD
ncbi:uncharacterized protein KD926_009413 [Aspergillus affinis]|uniref:uncharacterized protein n=1 Tax=Aspergillus affinis TaxID=1070780 RepID=UPI0022FE7339|nr:uncharacterized protein KD926_009413 [Aspergillus affinis]KAI9039399.1 hypothetical protein KD926_009413 [Aspergillus affinis]